MEKYIKYDFSDFEQIMFNFKNDQSPSRLRAIKDELNKFFKDSTCREVLFTKNTDRLFFGMCVIPHMGSDDIVEIITGDKKKRINAYFLEIDSKLLEIGLSAKELVAVILHEVSHLILDSTPTEEFRNALNIYLAKNNEHIIITDSIHYKELLSYAYKDSVRKFTSLFFKEDEEMLADEFAVACGYGNELESAYKKIANKIGTINRSVSNKLIVLQWTLRLYKDLKIRRIGAIHSLNKAMKLSASELEKREIRNIRLSINSIDDDALIQESTNVLVRKTSEMYKKFKYKGLRSVEDDLYEYTLRIKNVDEEDEALEILRAVNMRISMIDDYMISEKLDEKERERWHNVKHKYQMVRDELTKKKVYDDKFYGLFVNSPTIKDRYSM